MEEIIAFDDHFSIVEKKCEGSGAVISVTLIPTEEPNEYGKNKDFVEAFIKRNKINLNATL